MRRITTYILLLWLEEAHYVRAYTCPAVYGMVKVRDEVIETSTSAWKAIILPLN